MSEFCDWRVLLLLNNSMVDGGADTPRCELAVMVPRYCWDKVLLGFFAANEEVNAEYL